MRVTFCINGCAIKPIGGHKVLYEYANRLSERGYDVTIVFPSENNLYQLPLPASIRVLICKVLTDYFHIMPPWFRFNKKVKLSTVMDYSEKHFPDADFIVATANETAKPVSLLPQRCGKKIYFIQDYETWATSEDELNKTFTLGMKNVVVSNWLKELVEQYSENEVICIPNAIDTNVFRVKNSIEERKEPIVGLLYHPGEHKGLKYAFEALKLVKKEIPELKVIMFGAVNEPEGLPDWYEYHYRVDQKKLCNLYNRCSVFICASINEGFGLTGAESMACGCAFVSTGYMGVHEYAIDGHNALLSPIKDSKALANNICRMLKDDEFRIQIAKEGCKSMQNRSWSNVMNMFEEVLLKDK